MATGAQDEFGFEVKVSPGRVDFVISAATLEGPPPPTPLIVNTSVAIETLLASIGKLDITQIGDATRLSIITELSNPYSSLDDANAAFLVSCGFEIDLAGASDLGFKLNSENTLSTGHEINRLVALNV